MKVYNDKEKGRVKRMIQKIFSIRDTKADAFMQPFFAPTKGVAMRQFGAAVNKEGHDLNLYTDDYSLFLIGEFNDSTGSIEPAAAPEIVCAAHDLKEKE